MATTGDDRGSGVVGHEATERYEVEGVTYEVHPAARLFPRLEGKQFDELFYDIAMNGLREPVVVRGLEIVDGRNRLRAARRAGGTVRFEELGDDVDVYGFVASANLYRRHLTTSQRGMIAVRLVELSVRAQPLHARREATEKANRPSDTDGGPTAAASGGATALGMAQSPPSADGRPVAQAKPASDTQSPSDQHARSGNSASSSRQSSLLPPAPSQEAASATRGCRRCAPPCCSSTCCRTDSATASRSTERQRGGAAVDMQLQLCRIGCGEGAGQTEVQFAAAVGARSNENSINRVRVRFDTEPAIGQGTCTVGSLESVSKGRPDYLEPPHRDDPAPEVGGV